MVKGKFGKTSKSLKYYETYCRSKLNSIESKISEALINNEIINEGKKYQELEERIRMMNSHRSDSEKVNLIEEGKKIGINEFINHSKIINNSLKP